MKRPTRLLVRVFGRLPALCIGAERHDFRRSNGQRRFAAIPSASPTPGELFAALENRASRIGRDNIGDRLRDLQQSRANCAQSCGLIADGFIAVEAQDSQQVKNIGTDIIKLAKALASVQNVLRRGNSINEFCRNSEWDALQEELEATQNEVKSSMQNASRPGFDHSGKRGRMDSRHPSGERLGHAKL